MTPKAEQVVVLAASVPSLPSLIQRMLCLRRRCESAAVDTSELQNAHLLVAPADSHQTTHTHTHDTHMITHVYIENHWKFFSIRYSWCAVDGCGRCILCICPVRRTRRNLVTIFDGLRERIRRMRARNLLLVLSAICPWPVRSHQVTEGRRGGRKPRRRWGKSVRVECEESALHYVLYMIIYQI